VKLVLSNILFGISMVTFIGAACVFLTGTPREFPLWIVVCAMGSMAYSVQIMRSHK